MKIYNNTGWVILAVVLLLSMAAVGGFRLHQIEDTGQFGQVVKSQGGAGLVFTDDDVGATGLTLTNRTITVLPSNANVNLEGIFASIGVAPSGSNWNTAIQSGIENQLWRGGYPNAPTTVSSHYWHVQNYTFGPDKLGITQYAIPYSFIFPQAGYWVRARYNGSWTPWLKVDNDNQTIDQVLFEGGDSQRPINVGQLNVREGWLLSNSGGGTFAGNRGEFSFGTGRAIIRATPNNALDLGSNGISPVIRLDQSGNVIVKGSNTISGAAFSVHGNIGISDPVTSTSNEILVVENGIIHKRNVSDLPPNGDNLGNHTATQNLIMGDNIIQRTAASDESIRLTTEEVSFTGNFGGNYAVWLFSNHLDMPKVPNATNFTTTERGMKVFWKEDEVVDGEDRNRLYIHTEEDRTENTSGDARTYKIVTEQDFVHLSSMRTADILRTSGSFDTQLRTEIPFAGTYKVHLHLVFSATIAGGGVGWAVVATNLVNANSYFTRQDQFAVTSDWTTLNFLNAAGNVIDTNVALDYTGVMEFSAPTTVNITTGTNGVGNTTYAKGCYLTFTKIN